MVELPLKNPGQRSLSVDHIDVDKSFDIIKFLCLIQAQKRYADLMKTKRSTLTT